MLKVDNIVSLWRVVFCSSNVVFSECTKSEMQIHERDGAANVTENLRLWLIKIK